MISAGIYRCNALQRQRLYIYRSMYFNIYIQFRTLTTNLFVYLAQDYMAIAIIYLLQAKRAGYLNNVISLTPALAACQPRCGCAETIPPSPTIIHMPDEELGCPRNFRQGFFAHLPKFQGSLQKH